jgi:hypothetical protein
VDRGGDLRWKNRPGTRPGVRVPGLEMPWNPDTNLTKGANDSKLFENSLKFFVSPCPFSKRNLPLRFFVGGIQEKNCMNEFKFFVSHYQIFLDGIRRQHTHGH